MALKSVHSIVVSARQKLVQLEAQRALTLTDIVDTLTLLDIERVDRLAVVKRLRDPLAEIVEENDVAALAGLLDWLSHDASRSWMLLNLMPTKVPAPRYADQMWQLLNSFSSSAARLRALTYVSSLIGVETTMARLRRRGQVDDAVEVHEVLSSLLSALDLDIHRVKMLSMFRDYVLDLSRTRQYGLSCFFSNTTPYWRFLGCRLESSEHGVRIVHTK